MHLIYCVYVILIIRIILEAVQFLIKEYIHGCIGTTPISTAKQKEEEEEHYRDLVSKGKGAGAMYTGLS